jgi:hypothetical protein
MNDMKNQDTYNAEQDYNEYQRLINTVEILTQDEYLLCRSWDVEETEQYLNNIGGGRWLNINVYSEAEHDERQYKIECGL